MTRIDGYDKWKLKTPPYYECQGDEPERSESMDLVIRFNLDNAAFEVVPERECAEILRAISNRIIDGEVQGSMRDVNGNRIGWFEFVERDEVVEAALDIAELVFSLDEYNETEDGLDDWFAKLLKAAEHCQKVVATWFAKHGGHP